MRPLTAPRPLGGAGLVCAALVLAAPTWAEARPYRCQHLQADRWYTCLGAVRGRAGLLEELGTSRPSSRVLRLAGPLQLTEALPHLRRHLGPEGGAREWMVRRVVEALVELGDRASIPLLAELAARSLSESALRGLAELGGPEARAKALELARGIVVPPPSRDRRLLGDLLPVLVKLRVRKALPLLRRWAGILSRQPYRTPLASLVEQVRLLLWDRTLLKPLRRKLLRRRYHPYRAAELAAIAADPTDTRLLRRFVALGGRAAEAAYDAVDRLAREAPWLPVATQRKLRRVLAAHPGSRTRPGRRRRRRYRLSRRARQKQGVLEARRLATLARLGDTDARGRLAALLSDDPEERSSWVVARHAVELGLDRAAQVAVTLLASALRRRFGSSSSAAQRLRLLDRLATRLGARDGRWAVALLDGSERVRRRALWHLVRLRPSGACEAVAAVAPVAQRSALEAGLLALTVLGDGCAPALARLVADRTAPVAARGMALEVLGMLRNPAFEESARRLEGIPAARASLRRARQIAAHP